MKKVTLEDIKKAINDVVLVKQPTNDRVPNLWTGKGGVIEFELAMLREAGASEEQIEKKKVYLQETLEDGMYHISEMGVIKLWY